MAQPSSDPVRVSRVMQRIPFYYGWVVLLAGTLGNIMSSPGQTYSISIFIEHFITDLDISRSLVSTFYTVGTLVGSFVLPYVGRKIDQTGPRRVAAVVAALLALACFYMSTIQNGWMLLLGFVAVRMLGQGSLGLVSTYIVNQWWMRRRGTVMGISGVLMALLGVGGVPILVNWLIPQVGWRMTWVILGAALLVIMVPVALLFFRSRPEAFGLLPDGAKTMPKLVSSRGEVEEENWTAKEATHTPAFWIITLGMASISMLSTGLQFHMVRIFLDNHLSATTAASIYLPIAMTTALVTLASGYLVDRIPIRYLFMAALLLQAIALWMASSLSNLTMAMLYAIVLGSLNGLQRTGSTVVYASYFGRLHLGAISGISTTIMVAASALGSLPMALARDFWGAYSQSLLLLSAIPLLLIVVSFFMQRPRKALPSP